MCNFRAEGENLLKFVILIKLHARMNKPLRKPTCYLSRWVQMLRVSLSKINSVYTCKKVSWKMDFPWGIFHKLHGVENEKHMRKGRQYFFFFLINCMDE